ncbi:MAG: hypothetical protein AAF913_09600, partial [Pseudomonadota bacterium]
MDEDSDSGAATGAAPPYVDPKGRKILARHKQFAVRQARRMGLGLTDPNAALHKLAEMGVNIFANDEKLLDLATDA